MSGIGSDNGWLEAAIAWEVCASLHRQYCKGKDALFTTRQSDFVKHAENARGRAAHGQAPAGDWLWVKLMDFCKKRGFAPANFNDLFEIVDAARAARAPADSVQEDAAQKEKP